jgi:uncharacterized lipoprotein
MTDRTTDIIHKTYLKMSESVEPDEYYGFTCSLEQLKQTHDVVCLDENCMKTANSCDIKSGDVVFVSEDDETDIYSIKIV